MNEPTLRPCPFCGHAPELFNWCESFEISCENDDCGVQVNAVEKTKELVAAQWNGPDPWQPIATAPKDGSLIQIWGDGYFCIGKWFNNAWFALATNPTHWMPLPKGPQS